MFTEESKKYYAKGIRVVPIIPNGKHCEVKDWGKIDFEECADKYPNHGVGLSLGDCDLVVLDIDTLIKDEQKEYEDFLKDYPTPIMRKGNPNKLPSRFYSKTWQSGKTKDSTLELLNANKGQASVCVLPPTIHPEFKIPFEWVGKETLLSFDLSLLPPLPKEAWEGLLKIRAKYKDNKKVSIEKSDGTRCNHGSHDYLSKIMLGHVRDGESVDSIVELLLKEDAKINDRVSYFECPSRKEFKGTKKQNCEQFVLDCMKNQVKKGTIQRVEIAEPYIEPVSVPEFEPKDLPHLRGIGADMFDYIWRNAPVQRGQFSSASVLSAVSTILGNKIRCGAILPNIYTLMVAPSGYGKDYPLKFPDRLFQKSGCQNLIGDGNPSSDAALMDELPKNRVRLDAIDEASRLFNQTGLASAGTRFKIADFYADIYTTSGGFFKGKKAMMYKSKENESGKVGECFSPYISILAAMTDKAFRICFNTETIEKGLGARFLYFLETKKKMPRMIFNQEPIPMEFIDYVKMWRAFMHPKELIDGLAMLDPRKEFEIPEIKVNAKCQERILGKIEELNKIAVNMRTDSKARSIYLRSHVMMIKLAIMDCSMLNPKSTYLTLSCDNIDWAYKYIIAHNHNMQNFIEFNVSDTVGELKSNSILLKIPKEGITSSDLTRATRGMGSDRQAMLNELIASGLVRTWQKAGENGRPTTFYAKN
jgi:hypothetical protein